MRSVLVAAQERRAVITVPAVVVAEWWRVDSRRSRLILERVDVEPVSERLAKIAGEALAAVPGATAIDAIVMASATQVFCQPPTGSCARRTMFVAQDSLSRLSDQPAKATPAGPHGCRRIRRRADVATFLRAPGPQSESTDPSRMESCP